MSSPSPGNHWFSDSFQSANGPLSIYWQQPSGSWLVQGDAAVPQTSGVNIAVCPLGQSRVTSTVSVVIPSEPSGSSEDGPIVRLQGTEAYVLLLTVTGTTATAQLGLVNGASVTTLGSPVTLTTLASFPLTVVLSLSVNSESLEGAVDYLGTVHTLGPVLDSTLTCGGGVGIWDNSGQGTFQDYTAEALLWYGGCCSTCE
jgi:hypothetical protein